MVIESTDKRVPLFGDVFSLAGYRVKAIRGDERYYFVLFTTSQGDAYVTSVKVDLGRVDDGAEIGDMPFMVISGKPADDEEMRRRTVEAARFVFAFSFYALSPERVSIQDQGGPVARGQKGREKGNVGETPPNGLARRPGIEGGLQPGIWNRRQSAMKDGQTKKDFRQLRLSPLIYKCRDPELNWGHADFQSAALPTELSRQVMGPDYMVEPQSRQGNFGHDPHHKWFDAIGALNRSTSVKALFPRAVFVEGRLRSEWGALARTGRQG